MAQTLSTYVQLAQTKAKQTGRTAPSTRQIGYAVNLAHACENPGLRMNVFVALRKGISRNHCSLLIDQMKGKYVPKGAASGSALTIASTTADVTESEEQIPAEYLPDECDCENLYPLQDEETPWL